MIAPQGRAAAPDPQRLLQDAFSAYEARDRVRAEVLADRALALAPDLGRAWLLKGVVHSKDEVAVRLAVTQQATAVDPADPQAWYNLGVIRQELNQYEAAIAAYRRAVMLDPFMSDALGNGCELLRRADQFDLALHWADRRLRLPGGEAWATHLNRAICLTRLRRFDEANVAFDRALALSPETPIIHWERYSLLHFQRRFAEAWDSYEYRFACGHLNGVSCYPFPQPIWRGEPLTGKSIVIHAEQGLGDQLMYACAVNAVIAAAGAVTLVAAPTLTPLFAAAFPAARVLPARFGAFPGDYPPPAWLDDLGPIDFQAPIGSLMAVLRRDEASFDVTPYLRPSEAARAAWSKVPLGPGLKVGLCWASNPALFRFDSASRAVKKSMTLEAMAPLAAVEGVSFVSVLNWPIESLPEAFGDRLADLSDRLASMDDTAALIERLDLVITVDTAVAHLAGAMGKPTWLLLHDFADCRWELEADRSYWYRDVSLIRQSRPGDWAGVMAETAARLAKRAESGA